MLSPIVKLGSDGIWRLSWTPDPTASLYDIILSSGSHVQAGKTATNAALGIVKPNPMPQISAAHVGSYETAVDASVPAFTVASSIVDQQILTSKVSWEATPSSTVVRVEFYIDRVKVWVESYAPYVYNGDGNYLDPATLAPGAHTLTVIATKADGQFATTTSNVTVPAVVPPPPPSSNTDGRVQFCMYATSQADAYDLSPVPDQAHKDWMNQHWNRAIIYMDSIASWLVGDWGYNDMLQIYLGSNEAIQHPEWILKDAGGNKCMYNGHYLANPGNAAYQDYKAAQIGAMPARNYKGVHCDDVNMDRISNSRAIDPRTNALYILSDWQNDIANMMDKVRAAAPKPFEIVHNALWWASGPSVIRQIKASDVQELERGFNDPNYTPDRIEQLFAWCDATHALGVGLNHLSEASGQQAAHFNLACALLVSDGKDFVYGDGWRPDAWDTIYDKDLGASTGPRIQTSTHVWERSFTKGHVKADLNSKIGTLT